MAMDSMPNNSLPDNQLVTLSLASYWAAIQPSFGNVLGSTYENMLQLLTPLVAHCLSHVDFEPLANREQCARFCQPRT